MVKPNGKYARLRAGTALVLLLALTFAAGASALYRGAKSYPELPKTDPVTIHEARIDQVRGALPAGTAAVGYVTSVDNEKIFLYERTLRDVEFLAQYMLTQYTLAPVIVHNSPDRPLVVGNCITGSPDPVILAKHALVPLRDFGDGLVLYSQGPKP
ncbi:MAG: hypothetical protein A4E68_01811 [Syntrophaceae bacterium PtaB.Bin095]|nr:MAG: hypothetical protein A4E68_01811 [Syntrophaceae bacterium PtaB.Bin095]